jgi:O-antigen ligase
VRSGISIAPRITPTGALLADRSALPAPTRLVQFAFFAACLLSVIFFPTFAVPGDTLAGQRILYIAFPLALLFALSVTVLLGNRLLVSSLGYVLVFAFIIYSISIVPKLPYIDGRLLATHWRYLAYAAVFISAYNLSAQYKLSVTTLEKILVSALLLILLFVLAQAIQPNLPILRYISNRPIIGNLGVQIGGPFVWSYSLGHFLILVAFLLFARLWLGPPRFIHASLLAACLVLVALSQSKAVYLAFFVLFSAFFAFTLGARKIVRHSKFLLPLAITLGLAASVFAYFGPELGNIARFIDSMSAGGVDASTQTRLNQIGAVTQTIAANPWFGYPTSHLVIENAYGHYLYYFGLIGLIVYFFVLAAICFVNYRIMRISFELVQMKQLRPLGIGFLAYSVSTVILSLAYAPLDGHKSAYVFWFLLGCYHGVVRQAMLRRLSCTKRSTPQADFLKLTTGDLLQKNADTLAKYQSTHQS